jgi:glucosyl-3-phosphoglycerate synthase
MGIASTARLTRWRERRVLHHAAYPPERLRAERERTVSVCVPARETAATIGRVVDELLALRAAGAIDQVVVVDAASDDGTAEVAARHGAEVHQEAALMPGFGVPLGKGDAMWRALSVLTGDVVCYVDADSVGFSRHFACGLAGAIVCEPDVHFVKAAFRRPFRVSGVEVPDGGGRVNELMARPLLRRFYPELAALRQPLAGEVAARRELLERLPFATGYAVEVAMLIDAYREVGLDGIAEVDLDQRHNRHQPLAALAPMADTVLGAVAARLEREGRLASAAAPPPALAPAPVERPPMASVRAAVGAAAHPERTARMTGRVERA